MVGGDGKSCGARTTEDGGLARRQAVRACGAFDPLLGGRRRWSLRSSISSASLSACAGKSCLLTRLGMTGGSGPGLVEHRFGDVAVRVDHHREGVAQFL